MSGHATDLAYNWSGYQLGNNVRVSIGDVDGDNRLEVLATCCGNDGQPGTLYFFDWNGRAFVEKAKSSLGRIQRILNIKAGRFTGNTAADIIIITDNYFFIYQIHGQEVRRVFQSRYLGGRVVDVEIKDVTGDGRQELIIAIEGVGIQIYSWSGNQALLIGEIQYPGNLRVAVGDTTASGVAEIVVLKLGRGPGRDVVEVFSMRNRQLVLIAVVQLQVMATGPMKVGRISGTRREEIIIVTDGGRRVLVLGWQNSTFERIALSDSQPGIIREMVVGDWDNGNHNELVLGLSNMIVVLRLTGGTFVLVETIETPHPLVGMRMADLNGSGRNEIVMGSETGTVHFLRKIRETIVRPRPPIIVNPSPQPIIEPKSQFLVRENVSVPENFPNVLKVAEVRARPIVTRTNIITNKVIVSGFFDVDILVVAEPDRRVLSFSQKVPFVHFVHMPGLTTRDRVKVEVEVVFVDFRFDPRFPRQIEVIIVAEIFVFDHIVRRGETIIVLADRWKTDIDIIMEINQLNTRELREGQPLKMPHI
ncbi:MAG: DUF3794 domain-containing protein [Bacillota bacterium]|nr:DUF3794 domain-containing protein [Bacillota bacterium]